MGATFEEEMRRLHAKRWVMSGGVWGKTCAGPSASPSSLAANQPQIGGMPASLVGVVQPQPPSTPTPTGTSGPSPGSGGVAGGGGGSSFRRGIVVEEDEYVYTHMPSMGSMSTIGSIPSMSSMGSIGSIGSIGTGYNTSPDLSLSLSALGSSGYVRSPVGSGTTTPGSGPGGVDANPNINSSTSGAGTAGSSGTGAGAASSTPAPSTLTPITALPSTPLPLAQLGLAKVAEPDSDAFMTYAAIVGEFVRLEGVVVRG